MKNLTKIIIIFSFILPFSNQILAEAGSSNTANTSSRLINIKVTEKIPGAGCSDTKNKSGLYECKINPGFKTIQTMIGQIIKWFTAIASLAGVLFIVINGILLSMGGDGKDEIKKRIVKTIAGFVLLLLSGLILSIIAPWIYK